METDLKPTVLRLEEGGVTFPGAEGRKPEFVPAGKGETVAGLLRRLIERGRIVTGEGCAVAVDTPRCVLVPVEAFGPGMERGYMEVNRIHCSADEMVVASSPAAGIVALTVAPREAVECLRGMCGGVEFTSPLLAELTHPGRQGVGVLLTRRYAYVTALSPEPLYAEAVPRDPAAGMLYCVGRAGECLGDGFTVSLSGIGAASAAKLFRKYYKKVRFDAHY